MDIELIKLSAEHLGQVRDWRNSPEVSKYMYTDNLISEDEQKKWFDKVNSDSSCEYWIIQYDGKPVGLASITGISQTFSSCYWAFYLGDLSNRGAGIGAKIEYRILSRVFDELGLNKLRCEVFVTNEKVIRMHERFGFRREAYYREHCMKKGVFQDVVGLAMLKSEWELLKPILYKKVYEKAGGANA